MDQPAGIGGDPHLCGRSEFSLDLIDLFCKFNEFDENLIEIQWKIDRNYT